MSQNELDLSRLPEDAQQSLRDYYELLLERHGGGSEFDPTDYRGAIDVHREAKERIDSLRKEWSRDVG